MEDMTLYQLIYEIFMWSTVTLMAIVGIICVFRVEYKLAKKDDYLEIRKLRNEKRKIENEYLLARRSVRLDFWKSIFKRK